VDYEARTVTISGKPVPLPRKEFDILELLSLNPGQVFDRERIYETVWGLDGEGSSDDGPGFPQELMQTGPKPFGKRDGGAPTSVWGCIAASCCAGSMAAISGSITALGPLLQLPSNSRAKRENFLGFIHYTLLIPNIRRVFLCS
jgi:hypothetical protein